MIGDGGGQRECAAFRKSRRAASVTDDETWVDADHANTLNQFDAGDTRTTHAVVEQTSTLLAQHGRGHSLNTSMVDGGQLVPQTFSVYPEGGNGADIAAAKVECSPSLTKAKSERGIHIVNALDRQQGGPDDNSAQAGHLVAQAAAFMAGQGAKAGSIGYEEGVSPTLKAAASGTNQAPTLHQRMTVRRLTPVECERLMGWPDGFTAPEGVKAPDSKRYAACGDGIVAPVAFWIADRIRMIEEEEEI